MTRKCGTEWDAEDAIHDAFERAIRYYKTYNPEKSTFQVWFSRILVNAINDHLNKNKPTGDMEFDEDLAEGTPCMQYNDKVVDEIKANIDSRKPHIAEVLRMYFECGYAAKDISCLVEMSPSAINQTIYRFREELREAYKDGGHLRT